MSTIALTVLLGSVILVLGLLFMAIGWLLTGKSRIKPGMCGKNPHLKKEEEGSCGTCDLCEHHQDKK